MDGPEGGIRIRFGNSTREFPAGGTIRIGRDPSSDVVVNDPHVSRDHALLSFEDGTWILENRSDQGTRVEGEPITRMKVTDRIEVVLGDVASGERIEIIPTGASVAPTVPARTLASPPGGLQRPSGSGIVVRHADRDFHFDPDRAVLVGRLETADVTVESPYVSREHLRLVSDGSTWFLENVGKHGTFSEGKPITRIAVTGPLRVRLGDQTGEELEIIPDTAVLMTQMPPRASAPEAATWVPGGELSSRGTGQTSVIRRLTESNKRTQLIAAVAAVLALVLAAVAVSAFLTAEPSTEQVIEEAAPKTALILVDGRPGGSGWVSNAERGFIVTNAHVVEGVDSFEVGILGENRAAELLGIAPCDDLAVLQVADSTGLEEFELGSRSELNAGQRVITLGYPVTFSDRPQLNANDGTISVVQTDYADAGYNDLIEHNATINPGNSGGPLVSFEGELIGVNTLYKFLEVEGVEDSRPILNQFYSVSVETVQERTPTLSSGVSLGEDGIGPRSVVQITPPPALGIPGELVLVGRVTERSPAANAGISPPVRVRGALAVWGITSIDGSPIARVGDYCNAIRDKREGDTAQYRFTIFSIDGARIARIGGRRVTVEF